MLTVKDAGDFTATLGLAPRVTPVWSVERREERMSASFVETLKQDWVCITPLPGDATVLGLVTDWITYYHSCAVVANLSHKASFRSRKMTAPSDCGVKRLGLVNQ